MAWICGKTTGPGRLASLGFDHRLRWYQDRRVRVGQPGYDRVLDGS